MTTKKLFISLVFISIFVLMLGLSMGFDTWWHMKAGEIIWESKSVINIDPFSYTRAGETWYGPATNWLSELSLFGMFVTLGFQGLMLWVAILMTLSFLFIYLSMDGNSYWNGFVLILGVLVMSAYRLPRPVLVSTLMVAIFLWQFELFRKRKIKHLFYLPVLMILWANSHGGILLAVLIWGVYFVNELMVWGNERIEKNRNKKLFSKGWFISIVNGRIGHLILIAILLIVALSINPEGPRMIIYTFEQMDVELAIEKVNEWQSPNFHAIYMQIILGMLVASIFLMIYSKRKVLITDLLLLLGFFALMLIYVRFLPYFVLVVMMVIARYGNYVLEAIKSFVQKNKTKKERKELPETFSKRLNLVILIVMILVVLVIATDQYIINLDVDDYLAEILPIDAVAFLKEEGVQGNLFNKYGDGGYIIWEMPNVPVFVDGRADLYRDEILSEYHLMYDADEGWEDSIEKWGIETVIVGPEAGLAKVLKYENWDLVFEDDRAVVFYKK